MEVMRKMGFVHGWINWVLSCISTVSYSFVINGKIRGSIPPHHGIHKKDPISPCLFLLCVDVLSRLVSRAKTEKFIHGVAVVRKTPQLSHLLFIFTDDIVILFRPNVMKA